MATEDHGYSTGAVAFAFLAGAITGAVTGAIVGASTALLLAPQTGAETRDMLKGYAKKAEETVLEKAKEAKVTVESALEKGREFIGDKKGVLSAAFEAGREAMKKERA
jgi:gas vesicle protein